MLSRFVIAFLPRSKYLLISWLQSSSLVMLEPKKIKSVYISTFSPSICHEVMELDVMIFVFWMLSFKPAFWLSCFTLIKRLFSSSLFSAIRVVSWTYLVLITLCYGLPKRRSGKESACQGRRHKKRGFDPWVRNPLQYSCLGKSHGERRLAGYSPWGCKEQHDLVTKYTHSFCQVLRLLLLRSRFSCV